MKTRLPLHCKSGRLSICCHFTASFIVTTLFSLSVASASEDWPSWRGPAFDGSRAGKDYPTKWSSDKVAWKVALPGKGASCPIIWGDQIYVSSPDAGVDAVLAFNHEGKELWRTRLGKEDAPRHKTLGTSSNASPVTDGKGVFVYFKSGNLVALETDGKIRWQRNLTEEFGAEELYWDQGSSPILIGELLILARLHGGDSWIAGFDKATGEIRWKKERDYECPAENDHGYSSPIPFRHGDRDAMLVWCSDRLTAHAADDGSLLWSCTGFNPDSNTLWPPIATPVIAGGNVIVPVGRDDRQQAGVHAVRLGGEGDVSATHRAWERDDFGVFVASPVAYEGRVYLLRHKGKVVCLDPVTGKPHWEAEFPRESDAYYASPVIAGGILYAAREDGVVFAARIGENFEILGENDMGEQILATPVPLGGGRLLLRGSAHLFCVD
ncbi:MAG: PQQ-binding-like beta-propeller repeat protein [Verrucomicrobia bacterium]|nr:PQQ-binding-like beta-propeller repeat protein [Verrucomicrobiota bacterium]